MESFQSDAKPPQTKKKKWKQPTFETTTQINCFGFGNNLPSNFTPQKADVRDAENATRKEFIPDSNTSR